MVDYGLFLHFNYLEILIHDHFIEQRGRLVLGRSTEISTLMEYLQHGNPNAEDTKTENIPPLMVLASPGSGKSALMAHCTLEIKKVHNNNGIKKEVASVLNIITHVSSTFVLSVLSLI